LGQEEVEVTCRFGISTANPQNDPASVISEVQSSVFIILSREIGHTDRRRVHKFSSRGETMLSIRKAFIHSFALIVLGLMICPLCRAQAALLLEEPYGFFGTVNPTGHVAIYFERICAETPLKLRRCEPGEMGTVIARYQGIAGYDWVAIPLIPYLYSVENASEVPDRVDHDTVVALRNKYRERYLEGLGTKLSPGNLFRGGWTQLVGAAYERRIYAFRFHTSLEQDDALIEWMNAGPNKSKFNLLFSNCADFARIILNQYFPRTFRRSIFPDAGMTTPKQITYKLKRYAHRHPEMQLTVFEIPQIPGYRRGSRSPKGIDESIVTTVYAVPLAIANPYLAGGLFVDYLIRGRYHLIPKDPEVLGPENMSALTAHPVLKENDANLEAQVPGIVADRLEATQLSEADTVLKGSATTNE
jgi:hypothetical protein